MKFRFFINIFLFLSILFSEENNSLIYYETILPKKVTLNPYHEYPLKSNDKRVFSLIHETIYERNVPPYANFIDSTFQKLNRKTEIIDDENFYTYTLKMPEINLKWSFHNDVKVKAEDLVYSIKYAIKKGILNEDIFDFEKVNVDLNGNVKIYLKSRLDRNSFKAYLMKVHLIPKSVFNNFIDTGSNVTYNQDEKISDYNDQPYGTGPFEFKNETSESFSLKRFDNYSRGYGEIEQIIIKEDPLRINHLIHLENNLCNLVIDVPYPYDKEKGNSGLKIWKKDNHIEIKKIETNEANVLFINHTNQHLKNKNFRKALAYIINKKSIRHKAFGRKCQLLKSPLTSKDGSGNDAHIAGYHLSTEESFKKYVDLIKSLPDYKLVNIDYNRYKVDTLLYRNKPVRFNLIHISDILEKEKQAIDAIADYFSRCGIGMTVKNVQAKRRESKNAGLTNWEMTRAETSSWDFMYDYVSVEPGESLEKYYSKNGEFFQYTNYSNDKIENLLIKEQKIGKEDPVKFNKNRKNITKELSEDVASIFLWAIHNYYAYDTQVIDKSNERRINYHNFFTEPEFWEFVKDD